MMQACHQHAWKPLSIPDCPSWPAVQELVRKFQTTASIPLFLLTSQVGGLGLTLTAADRVIVVDPSWNPSTDNQAVDR